MTSLADAAKDVRERTVRAMLHRYSAEMANSDSVGVYAKQLGIETANAGPNGR